MAGVFDHIKLLDEESLNILYGKSNQINSNHISKQSIWTCKAIFQSLSALAKNYILRLLNIHEYVRINDCKSWINNDNKHLHYQVLNELYSFKLLIKREQIDPIHSQNKVIEIMLNNYFRNSFISSLSNPFLLRSNRSNNMESKSNLNAVSSSFLDNFFVTTWEKMLYYLINNSYIINDYSIKGKKKVTSAKVSPVVDNFLLHTGLLAKIDKSKSRSITNKGYEFMLLDRHSQVWSFLQAILLRYESQGDVLSLIFMLSYCECGVGYLLDDVNSNQRQLLNEFSNLGIVYLPEGDPKYFYPTKIIIDMVIYNNKEALILSNNNLTNALITNNTSYAPTMTIIVETNCQVVAYVTNELHFNMLKLFVDVTARLPGMAIGRLTRDKAKAAYQMGISAAQIVEFLLIHTHPVVGHKRHNAANNSGTTGKDQPTVLLPENIIDQLVLWENECTRIQIDDVIVIDMAADIDKLRATGPAGESEIRVCEKLLDYAKKMGLCVWSNEENYSFAVSVNDFPIVQKYAISLGFS